MNNEKTYLTVWAGDLDTCNTAYLKLFNPKKHNVIKRIQREWKWSKFKFGYGFKLEVK